MRAAHSKRRPTGVRAASGTAPGIEEIVIRGSQCTVSENRLDKHGPLGLDGGDLFNGSTRSVGCVHRIAWATAHSAGPGEGPCAAFRCFRASPLRILKAPPPCKMQTLAKTIPCKTRANEIARLRVQFLVKLFTRVAPLKASKSAPQAPGNSNSAAQRPKATQKLLRGGQKSVT